MKVRDPKRIIMPGSAPSNVDMAVQEMRQKEAMENNPFIRMLRDMQQQLAQVSAQQQVLMIRLQALTDYMAQAGLLLHQDLDERGAALGGPYTPELTNTSLFEALSDEHVIEMPKNGYTAYLAEYSIRTRFLANLLSTYDRGEIKFAEVLLHIRTFNAEEGRLVPITSGAEFGLVEYLSQNPDKLAEEELDAIAVEFGLRKGGMEDVDQDTPDETQGQLSIEELDAPEESEAPSIG